MNIKEINKKNLEFLTNQLNPAEDIQLKKNTKTFILYDPDIKAIIELTKKRRTRHVELKKYDEDISIIPLLPALLGKKYIELPKEENLEEIMQGLSYNKIKEENGYETYKRKIEKTWGAGNVYQALKNFNVREQFKEYFQLWKDEPEFKLYEVLNIISNASSGALLGAVMPSFWDYGGTLKLAGTLAAIQKIVTPMTNMAVSGGLGKVVDKATKTTDIKDLKNMQKKIGGMYIFLAGNTYLMQQNIIQMSPAPEATLLTLYALQTIGLTTGKMSMESKSFYAVRNHLLVKNPESKNPEYEKKFFQIYGTGQALSQLCYAATFTPSWLICKACPPLILPIATVSAISLVTSKFLWGFQRRFKNPVLINADEYVEKNNQYIFDSGWTIKPKEETDLEKKIKGYKLPLREGITIKAEEKISLKEEKWLEFTTSKGIIKIKPLIKYEKGKKPEKKYNIDKINDNEYKISVID